MLNRCPNTLSWGKIRMLVHKYANQAAFSVIRRRFVEGSKDKYVDNGWLSHQFVIPPL